METECPIQSLRTCLPFDSRDWSVDKNDAWIYGIVCGWNDAIVDVAKVHGWADETVARLQRLHLAFKAKST
jgi:hypothetical protein